MTTAPRSRTAGEWALAGLGVLFLALALPAAMLGWFALPEGRWPAVVAGLPAIPLVWVGVISLRRAGFPVEDFMRRRPRTFGLIVGIGGFFCVFFGYLLAVALG